MPKRQHRDERGLRAGIVGGFRRRDAADVALAEIARRLRDVLLERIGGERREQRAAARQHAENGAQRRCRAGSRRMQNLRSARLGHTRPTAPVTMLVCCFFSRL